VILGTRLVRRIKEATSIFSLVVCIAMSCGTLYAQTNQTITIQMLDSKTGRPITTSEFQVWANHDTSRDHIQWVRPDKDGAGELTLAHDTDVIRVLAQYGPAQWPYVNCDGSKDRAAKAFDHWYPVSEILNSGVAAPNHCSSRKAIAKPGEFIFFVRPMNFWEKFRE